MATKPKIENDVIGRMRRRRRRLRSSQDELSAGTGRESKEGGRVRTEYRRTMQAAVLSGSSYRHRAAPLCLCSNCPLFERDSNSDCDSKVPQIRFRVGLRLVCALGWHTNDWKRLLSKRSTRLVVDKQKRQRKTVLLLIVAVNRNRRRSADNSISKAKEDMESKKYEGEDKSRLRI